MEKYYDIYSLFRESFPQLTASYDSFTELLSPDECRIIRRTENGEVVGCAVWRGGNIRLLCVPRQYRGKGIGSSLLMECETEIKRSGFKTAVLGDEGWFLLGAVLSEEEWGRQVSDFFKKRGYDFNNTCMEMYVNAADFDKSVIHHAEADYRFIRADEHDKLIRAVEKVDREWCRYFSDDSCTFAAFVGDEIASFCIVEDNCTTLLTSGGANIGSVGCVGTVPKFRRNGYGLSMVAQAMDILIKRGCGSVYIHDTYLEKWYGRLGAKVLLYFGRGQKAL